MAQDLKKFNPRNPIDTHADTPGLEILRLIFASFCGKRGKCSGTDFDCAYLQTSKRGRDKWILIRFYNPVALEWQSVGLTGVIYGEQTGAHDWFQELKGHFASHAMKEVANMPSVYTITPKDFKDYVQDHGLPEMLQDDYTPNHGGPVGRTPQNGMAAGPIGRIMILVHVDDPLVFADNENDD